MKIRKLRTKSSIIMSPGLTCKHRLGWKDLPETNTLAYYVYSSFMKKKVWYYWTQVVRIEVFTEISFFLNDWSPSRGLHSGLKSEVCALDATDTSKKIFSMKYFFFWFLLRSLVWQPTMHFKKNHKLSKKWIYKYNIQPCLSVCLSVLNANLFLLPD